MAEGASSNSSIMMDQGRAKSCCECGPGAVRPGGANNLLVESEVRIRSADRGEGPESHCDQLALCLGEETAWEVM